MFFLFLSVIYIRKSRTYLYSMKGEKKMMIVKIHRYKNLELFLFFSLSCVFVFDLLIFAGFFPCECESDSTFDFFFLFDPLNF